VRCHQIFVEFRLKYCTDKRLIEVVRHLVARIIFGAGSNNTLAFAGKKSADREYREEIVDRGPTLVCPNY
jgi:hypothetical protein